MSAPLEQTIVPRYPRIFWGLVAVCLLVVGYGIWCFAEQTGRGFAATNLRNPGYGGAAWGLYIAFDVFFVGVSFAGITVSALSRLLGIQALKPATRLAELVTIVALLAGGCVIMADLGRPLVGLLNLPRFARPQSPFYGTFTLVVAGYLFSSWVFFTLSGRRDAGYMAQNGPRPLRWWYRIWASGHRDSAVEARRHHVVSFWLSVLILPLLVTAHSTLGFIFGLQSGRPGWYGALQAPGFVILAGVSGTGMVIILLAAARRLFGLEDRLPKETLRWLSHFMATLALVYLYFMIVEELTASYAAPKIDRAIAHEVVSGDFSLLFWITVIGLVLTFAIPFIMRLRRVISIAAIVSVAVLANIAAIAKRLLIVVPSQTHGSLLPVQGTGDYTPNYIEVGIVLGLFGILVGSVLLFGRIFPLVPSTSAVEKARPGTSGRERGRLLASVGVALVALAMIGFGLADSFRLFRNELDPLVPYSPVIFAGGVMVLFAAAIVYEIFPARRRDSAEKQPSTATESDS